MDLVSAVLAVLAIRCEQGQFQPVGAPDAIVMGNVRRLAGYRRSRHRLEPVATRLLAAFAEPQPLVPGASAVGDSIGVLPVLFHLLRSHELTVDVSVMARHGRPVLQPGD